MSKRRLPLFRRLKKKKKSLEIKSSYFNSIYRAHFCVYMVLKVSVASGRVKGEARRVVFVQLRVFFPGTEKKKDRRALKQL